MTAAECPCGQAHQFTPDIQTAYENITRGLPETVAVTIARVGSWLVPRIDLAAHGMPAADLPELAERYGFEQAGT